MIFIPAMCKIPVKKKGASWFSISILAAPGHGTRAMTSLAWPRCLKLQESNRKLEEAHQLLQGTKSECQELLLGRRVGIGQESWGDSCCFFGIEPSSRNA